MLLDQLSEPEALLQFTDRDQAAVQGDVRSFEIDLERRVDGKLKGSVSYFTHCVLAAGVPSSRPHAHEY